MLTLPVLTAPLRSGSDEIEPLAFSIKAQSPSERHRPDCSELVPYGGTTNTGLRSPLAPQRHPPGPSSGKPFCPPTPSHAGSTHPQIPRRLAVPPAVPRNSGWVDGWVGSPNPGDSVVLASSHLTHTERRVLTIVGCQGSARFFSLPESLLTVTSNVKLFLLL